MHAIIFDKHRQSEQKISLKEHVPGMHNFNNLQYWSILI